jgi:hypothetical protein
MTKRSPVIPRTEEDINLVYESVWHYVEEIKVSKGALHEASHAIQKELALPNTGAIRSVIESEIMRKLFSTLSSDVFLASLIDEDYKEGLKRSFEALNEN